RSHIELAEDMICQIEGWFPTRVVVVCADGAYASLARASLTAARFFAVSAWYCAPCSRAGRRGSLPLPTAPCSSPALPTAASTGSPAEAADTHRTSSL